MQLQGGYENLTTCLEPEYLENCTNDYHKDPKFTKHSPQWLLNVILTVSKIAIN